MPAIIKRDLHSGDPAITINSKAFISNVILLYYNFLALVDIDAIRKSVEG